MPVVGVLLPLQHELYLMLRVLWCIRVWWQ
jgi:hypothetical protein